jgi:hypothetical protein
VGWFELLIGNVSLCSIFVFVFVVGIGGVAVDMAGCV